MTKSSKDHTSSRRRFLKVAAAGAAATAVTPTIVRAQGPISMRWQSTWPAKDIFHEYALDHAKKVNDMTGGDLNIEVPPAGAVVPAFGLLDAVSKGTLDGGYGVLAYHYGKRNALALWGSGPGYAMDANMLLAWHKYGGGKELLDKLYASIGANVVSFPYGPMPTQPLGWYKKPMTKVEVFQGLKFRTVGISIDALTGLGSAVNALPGGEVVSAMDRGLLDAAEFNNVTSDRILGFADVSKICLLQSSHQNAEQLEILFNKTKFDALPEKMKAILSDGAPWVGLRAMAQERPVRVERRLSAILAADVAGYCRLMHHDEEATHAKLTALLADSVMPAIAEHRGRIVKNTGDGFLAEFPSAVEAVRAATHFQARVHELTIGDAEDRRIAFRVGINIGDVIVEPHDIFGDGVNIAARLESIAEPAGICISSAVYEQVRGKVGVEFDDLGEQNLKNIARPVRTYAVVGDGPTSATQVEGALLGSLSPPRLSIIVLPFANLSGDPEQDYFVDGVTESLTTDLSRISGSFVIGRHTAFTYKGKAVDLRQIGRELNVRYVLEGSVQRSGNRLRVNVQLIDAETASHLWAERFDNPIADLFDMQDEIVARLARALGAQLVVAEARRAERSLRPDAIDLIFQGTACLYKGWSPEYMTQAHGFFGRALGIDPRSVGALVGLAIVDIITGSAFLTDDRTALLSAAETNAIKALSLAPDDAMAHLILASVYMFTNRAAQGISECEEAIALNRNSADAHSLIGFAKYYLGRAAQTEGDVLKALRLSPRDVNANVWMYCEGRVKIHLGADAEAVDWLRRSIEANRNFPRAHLVLAAALALIGAVDDARTAAKAGLALNPGFTIRRFRVGARSDNPTYLAGLERACTGMRLAGVPEG